MAEDGDDAHVGGLVLRHLGEGAQLLHDLTVLQVVLQGALQIEARSRVLAPSYACKMRLFGLLFFNEH